MKEQTAIIDCSQNPPTSFSTEVLIIGSGCAGATAAWELALAGHEVTVLEEGGDYTGIELNGRDAQMYDQLYMERGGRATADLGVSVLQGRVLGGGGGVNACDVVPIPEGVLNFWANHHGLSDFAPSMLRDAQAAALRDLSANLPTDDQLNQNNRLLRQGASALGWKGEVMLHNRVGCAGYGTCLIGCPLNAKRNPRFVAIPQAQAAGATFYIRARAVSIEHSRSELKRVTVRCLDSKGYQEQGEFSIRAKTVILAANAVASTQLLLRSGIGNPHVGRHLSIQPQLPVTALFEHELRSFRGIPQAYAVTEFEDLESETHGWWGYRIESIFGTPGIVASLLPMGGAKGKELMSHYSRLAAVLVLAPDEPAARIEAKDSGQVKIHHSLSEDIKSRLRAGAKASAQAFFAAGAKQVLVPNVPPIVLNSMKDLPLIDTLSLAPATVPLLSAHQQGGIRMSPNPRTGAVSPEGLVYGTQGIYAFDSSIYPSSASSHTMAPIIAISRLLSRRLAGRA